LNVVCIQQLYEVAIVYEILLQNKYDVSFQFLIPPLKTGALKTAPAFD
jgi:hypothetical protein